MKVENVLRMLLEHCCSTGGGGKVNFRQTKVDRLIAFPNGLIA